MWYKVDFKKLVVLLLPISLRQPLLITLFQVFIEPLENIHYEFTEKRTDTLYKIAHNGQVCYMRKALNDKFDRVDRRVKIKEGNQYQREYIYTDPEKKPKYLGVIYIREDADYADTGVDFIVQIPEKMYKKYEVEAIIDYYKLASKRYKIELT